MAPAEEERVTASVMIRRCFNDSLARERRSSGSHPPGRHGNARAHAGGVEERERGERGVGGSVATPPPVSARAKGRGHRPPWRAAAAGHRPRERAAYRDEFSSAAAKLSLSLTRSLLRREVHPLSRARGLAI